MLHFLLAPLMMPTLHAIMAGAATSPVAETSPTGVRVPVQRSLHVLIVDDEAGVVDEIAYGLRRRGFNVLTAASAREAMDVLRARNDIGAVVCDLRMPGIDGAELARWIVTEHPSTRAVEVVMISGHGTADDEAAAIHAGAFAFLHKPFLVSDLRSILDDALARALGRRRPI